MGNLFGKVKIWLQAFIGLGYILLGTYVAKEKWFLTLLDNTIAYILGTILILYGLFRIYRAFQIQKEESL
ncbi:C4-dicarboxylate ABC transporter [Lacihabitans sp. LS3-19]|nr:C4-dicarboxylate ABC transporter [Lacihabitans sp. LS3-19]